MTNVAEKTSVTLLQGVSENLNPSALDCFSRQYRPIVRAAILSVVRDVPYAEDVTQEFFLTKILTCKLLRAYDANRGRFRTFLSRAARNFAISQIRGTNHETHMEAIPAPVADEGSDPAAWQEQAENETYTTYLLSLLDEILSDARVYAEENNQQLHYKIFRRRFLDHSGVPPTWRTLAEEYGLTGKDKEKTAEKRAGTVTRRIRKQLKELLALEAASDPDNELVVMERSLYGAMAQSSVKLFDRLDLDKMRSLFMALNKSGSNPESRRVHTAFQEELDLTASAWFSPAVMLGKHFVARTHANSISLGALESAKDLAKQMQHEASNPEQRNLANFFYHFCIAGAYRTYGVNISSRQLDGRVELYEQFAYLDSDLLVAEVFLGCVSRVAALMA